MQLLFTGKTTKIRLSRFLYLSDEQPFKIFTAVHNDYFLCSQRKGKHRLLLKQYVSLGHLQFWMFTKCNLQ